jgi:hypothetical protein
MPFVRMVAGWIGLVMKSTAPASKPLVSSPTSLSAVRKITGMSRVAVFSFRRRQVS